MTNILEACMAFTMVALASCAIVLTYSGLRNNEAKFLAFQPCTPEVLWMTPEESN
jgi:hypothetical protein